MATQLTNYQCPACTGPLHFDGASGKLVCDFCGSSYDTAEIEALYAEKEAAAETAAQNKQAPPPDSVWSENEAAGLRSYSCPSCGAELICDETTAATSCPYCGNPTVIAGQFSGMQRPELVLPFVLDKNAAKAALKKYYRGKRFLPNAFSSQNHIEEIKGVYVPFWLFDANASGSGQYEATTSSSHRNGDYVITTTRHYDVRRAGTTQFMARPRCPTGIWTPLSLMTTARSSPSRPRTCRAIWQTNTTRTPTPARPAPTAGCRIRSAASFRPALPATTA